MSKLLILAVALAPAVVGCIAAQPDWRPVVFAVNAVQVLVCVLLARNEQP